MARAVTSHLLFWSDPATDTKQDSITGTGKKQQQENKVTGISDVVLLFSFLHASKQTSILFMSFGR